MSFNLSGISVQDVCSTFDPEFFLTNTEIASRNVFGRVSENSLDLERGWMGMKSCERFWLETDNAGCCEIASSKGSTRSHILTIRWMFRENVTPVLRPRLSNRTYRRKDDNSSFPSSFFDNRVELIKPNDSDSQMTPTSMNTACMSTHRETRQ